VALDAFLLRTILVPALMYIFGDANWWLPRRPFDGRQMSTRSWRSSSLHSSCAAFGQQFFDRCWHVGIRQVRECAAGGRWVEGHVDGVHGERCAGLARQCRRYRAFPGQAVDHIRDTEPDPRRILTAWGAFVTEIAPRAAPILALARDAAASDPEIAVLLDEISASSHERMTLNARGLANAGHLRPGITISEAADILWAYSSPELYELLVIRRGWPVQRYGHFVGQALIAALLPPRQPG
jgi:hypothetical protein